MKRDELFKIIEQMNIPYIKIEIMKDHVAREESPIGRLSDTFETIVNGLLADIINSKTEFASEFLAHLQNNMDEYAQLINSVSLEIQNVEKKSHKTDKGHQNTPDETPIADVWLNAFDQEDETKDE